MIVSEIYDGSGIGNQLWHIIVPKIIAERMGYDWGIQKKPTTPFKACAFMTNFDMGKPVIGGHGPEGGPPLELPEGITDYYLERRQKYPSYMGGEEMNVFDEHLWNGLKDNTKVEGYFQNMSYINHRRDDIIKWLDYDNKITDYSSDDICVIQFRGGDYLTGASWVPAEYYQNAAKYMLQKNPNMKFVCVTDDPGHARQFIPFAEVVGSNSPLGLPFDLPNSAASYKLIISGSEGASASEIEINARAQSMRLRALERVAA